MRSGWTAAPSPQRPVLFVNPRSGGGKATRAGLAERARDHGIDVIVVRPDDTLAMLVDEAVAHGADALGVAGGDGSLAVVAAAAEAQGLPFVCVPAGTRNHFALDLGIDRQDLLGSLEALTDGVERRIDVAEVNGRVFLNNVSLGIYGDAVRQPEYRDAKARTLLQTAAEVIGPSSAAVDVQLVDDRGHAHQNPAVVLVSNNPYSFNPPGAPGTRLTLDSGKLGIVVLDMPRGGHSPGRAWNARRLEVTAAGLVHAGVDGEAVDLTPPLEFTIRPGALRVRIPSGHARVSPSAPLR
jgi:diacylglycerol kinase family enzyme